VNSEHQHVQLMIEKARGLVKEQGVLVKERQQLGLDLRRIAENSRNMVAP
jgi:hypothetical protein